MDVHEYQAKELLAQFGVPVPKGAVAFSPDQAVYAATELGGWNWAVKAQIHAGARGKAGGIKLCKTYHEVREAASDMLGKRLVTIQTGPEGKPVQRVYIEVAEPFEREIYLGKGRRALLPVLILALAMGLTAFGVIPVAVAFFAAAVAGTTSALAA